jgi:hypothetical protein
MREGTTPRVKTADRPYGEFYDFYSVSPEYFGCTLVCWFLHLQPISTPQRIYIHIQQGRSRTIYTVQPVATNAIYFLVHDVLVLRDILQFEVQRFELIPGVTKF